MESIKASVIMPVYNVEAYLEQSIDDVLRQTLQEIELICVDDGSTDRSPEILKRKALEDPRIRILTQENLFAGTARNKGLDAARGKYVICWDSDDRFHPDALEKMYLKAEAAGADLCICNARKYDEQKKVYVDSRAYLREDLLPAKDPFNKSDRPDVFYNITTYVPWNKLYLREFIENNHLRYQQIRQANDTYFAIMALFYAERITYVDDILVDYRTNNSTSLTGKASSTIFCAYDAHKYAYDCIKDHPDFSMVRGGFSTHALGSLLYTINNQTTWESYKALYEMLAEEGFASLGLKDTPREGFLDAHQYKDMQDILTLPAEEYLLNKSIVRRLNWEREKSRRTAGDKEVSRLKKEADKLNRERKDLKHEKQELQAAKKKLLLETERLLDENESLKKANKKLQKNLDSIHNTKFYKLYQKYCRLINR